MSLSEMSADVHTDHASFQPYPLAQVAESESLLSAFFHDEGEQIPQPGSDIDIEAQSEVSSNDGKDTPHSQHDDAPHEFAFAHVHEGGELRTRPEEWRYESEVDYGSDIEAPEAYPIHHFGSSPGGGAGRYSFAPALLGEEDDEHGNGNESVSVHGDQIFAGPGSPVDHFPSTASTRPSSPPPMSIPGSENGTEAYPAFQDQSWSPVRDNVLTFGLPISDEEDSNAGIGIPYPADTFDSALRYASHHRHPSSGALEELIVPHSDDVASEPLSSRKRSLSQSTSEASDSDEDYHDSASSCSSSGSSDLTADTRASKRPRLASESPIASGKVGLTGLVVAGAIGVVVGSIGTVAALMTLAP